MGDLGTGTCESLCIPLLMKEISSCISTLDKTQQCIYKSHYQDIIKQGRYQVLSIIRQIKEQNCRKPSLVPKQDIEREIFMAEMESEIEETKIDHVRKEWSQQQQSLARLQEYLYKKCRLLSLHSSYCSTQGSALCAILARLMVYPELVAAYLAEPDMYLVNFIKIADGCLFSFVKTYASDAPIQESTDYRYILTLYSCIVHISTLPTGRQFLIQRKECQDMLSEITYIIPLIKHSTIKALKILLLKLLHNLKSEEDGLSFLRGCSEMYSTLDACISAEYDPETHTYALELLEGVTKNIPTKEELEKVTKIVNTQRLKELSGQMYAEVKHIPRKIFQNIRIAAEKIVAREQAQAQGDVKKSQSAIDACVCKSQKSLEAERTSSTTPSRKICSQPKMDTPSEKTKPKRVVCRPPSPQSSSMYHSTTSTSCPPSRDTPERRSRPVSHIPRAVSSPKPVTLCTSPCRYLFPESPPCVCKTRISRERPTNIPANKKCIPVCGSHIPVKRPASPLTSSSKSKRTGSSSSGYRPPCDKPVFGGRASSGNRPSSNDRPCSSSSKPSNDRSCSYKRPSSGRRSPSNEKRSSPKIVCTSTTPPSKVNSSSRGSRAPTKEKPSSSKIPCPSKVRSSSANRICSDRPVPKDRPSSCKIPCSGSKSPCDERSNSGNVLYRIKDKLIELASSASKRILDLAHGTPKTPSCGSSSNTKGPGKSSGNKLTFATKSCSDKKPKTPSKISCGSSSKKRSTKPVASKSSRSDNKKVPCPCANDPKNKNVVKSPSGKDSRACAPTCKGSCKYRKRKVSSPSPKPSKKRCSCASSKAKQTTPNPKEPTLKADCAKSEAKEASSDLESKTPKLVCTDKPPSSNDNKPESKLPVDSEAKQECLDSESKTPKVVVCASEPLDPEKKNSVSFTVSIETKTSSEQTSCVKDIKACGPPCTSSVGKANTATPVNSTPSVTVTVSEKEICVCGSQSERRLVPWTDENRMVARLSEVDRRVFHHAQNTIRIVSRIDHNAVGRTQRVVTRIKIPGMRFRRVTSNERKNE